MPTSGSLKFLTTLMKIATMINCILKPLLRVTISTWFLSTKHSFTLSSVCPTPNSLLRSYFVLAFTRPKACREVGPSNWTQEHKSVSYGPPSKATGHAPKPARDWPVPKSDLRPARTCVHANSDRRPLGRPALVARGDFFKIGHFATFPNFYTLKVEIFLNDLSVHVYLWPL